MSVVEICPMVRHVVSSSKCERGGAEAGICDSQVTLDGNRRLLGFGASAAKRVDNLAPTGKVLKGKTSLEECLLFLLII